MKSFRQHLNDLEKKRKLANVPTGKGYIDTYVHGKHAVDHNAPTGKGYINTYVHGKHSRNDINEEYNEAELTQKDLEGFQDTHEFQKDHPDKKEIDKILSDHYDPLIGKHPDFRHVYAYSKSSRLTNQELIKSFERNGHNSLPIERDDIEERKNGLDRFLTSFPAPQDITTYAGLGYHPLALATADPRDLAHLPGHEHLANMKPEEGYMYLHSPAYQSSAVRFNIGMDFAHAIDPVTRKRASTLVEPKNGIFHYHVARIHIPKGSNMGAYINGISNFGRENGPYGNGELELLHTRGSTTKMRNIPTFSLTNAYGVKNRVYHVWDYVPVASIHPGLIKPY
jgi:hypothetical protein